ncbi:MAG TPA: hypothetical protein VN923_16865 [Thermoanaerobaculia bacterium]|nr:hypothetical protein [Thermoanaerobaculia bacterium]
MTPEQWRRVRVLFDVAGQLPVQQRRAFLRNACAEEPELRQEVESLLEAASEAGDFLEAGALHEVTWPEQPPSGEELALSSPAPPQTQQGAPSASGPLGRLGDAIRRRLGRR